MTLDPREIFRSQFTRGWGDIVASKQFEAAALSSIAAMQMELPHPDSVITAAANHYRMDGARRFLHILRNLAETQKTETQQKQTLNYKV